MATDRVEQLMALVRQVVNSSAIAGYWDHHGLDSIESAIRAALAQAEQDAYERAAKVCEYWRDKAVRNEAELAPEHQHALGWQITISIAHSLAAAIRQLAADKENGT